MSTKTRHNVANSSICFFCFKPVQKHDLKKRNNTELCQRFYKMLQPSAHSNGSLISSKWKKLNKEKTLCSKACSDCMTIIDMHCQLHFELQCVQMKLQWQLKKLSSVMRCANKVPSRLKQFRENLEEFGNKDDLQYSTQFRTYIIERCNAKWKNIGPSLKLNRVDTRRGQETEKVSKEMDHIEEKVIIPEISDCDSVVIDTPSPLEVHVEDESLMKPDIDLDHQELEENIVTDKDEDVVDIDDKSVVESKCNGSDNGDIINKVNETNNSIDLNQCDALENSSIETSAPEETVKCIQTPPDPNNEDNLCLGDSDLFEKSIENSSESSITPEKRKGKKKAKADKESESKGKSKKRKSSLSPTTKDACTDTIGISSNAKTFEMLLEKKSVTENDRRTSTDNTSSIESSDDTIFQEPKDLIEIPLLHIKHKPQNDNDDEEYRPNEIEEQFEDSGSEFEEFPPKKKLGYANKPFKKKT